MSVTNAPGGFGLITKDERMETRLISSVSVMVYLRACFFSNVMGKLAIVHSTINSLRYKYVKLHDGGLINNKNWQFSWNHPCH